MVSILDPIVAKDNPLTIEHSASTEVATAVSLFVAHWFGMSESYWVADWDRCRLVPGNLGNRADQFHNGGSRANDDEAEPRPAPDRKCARPLRMRTESYAGSWLLLQCSSVR